MGRKDLGESYNDLLGLGMIMDKYLLKCVGQ